MATKKSFQTLLEKYALGIDELANNNASSILSVLLIRDEIETTLQDNKHLGLKETQKLTELDKVLEDQLGLLHLDEFAEWRHTIQPSKNNWWWWVDIKKEEEKNFLWELLTSLVMLFSTTVSVQIIRKLWDGSPDNVSIFGTLLLVAITSSPITTRGREFANWLLKKLRIKRAVHTQAMTTMAVIAFLLVITVQFAIMPQLARYYNTEGLTALAGNELTIAKQSFQRAVAINPDYAIGYYHVAKVYKDIAQYENAISWYESSIEINLDFPLAYIDLANIKIESGDYGEATNLLNIALSKSNEKLEGIEQEIVNYAIWVNLGWTFFEKKDYVLAQSYLEKALLLEGSIPAEYRSARLYYLLAKINEFNDQSDMAIVNWENVLKYVDQTDPKQIAWRIEALQKVEEE